MKMSKLATGLATAAMLCASSTGLATAATADSHPASQSIVLTRDATGTPTSGMVVVDLEDTVGPQATKNVGGGTWTYGTSITITGTKTCYSKYTHKTKTHTATATMGTKTSTRSAKPGAWANAEVSGGLASGTCNTYWSTQ